MSTGRGHGLDALPAWRQEQLMWTMSGRLDRDGVDRWVRARSAIACQKLPGRTRLGWRAALGGDRRWHLVDPLDRIQCINRWTSPRPRHIRRLADQTERREPATVQQTERCPAYPGLWPAAAAGRGRAATTQQTLIEALGAICHCCGDDLADVVDHDHLTGLVRGFVCRHCNNLAEKCVDTIGQCHVIRYLADPPAKSLALPYPHHSSTLRRARSRNRTHGLEPPA